MRFSTTFRLHNYALKANWYKKWHDYRYAHHLHVATAVAYGLAVVSFVAIGIISSPSNLFAASDLWSKTVFDGGTDGSYVGVRPANTGGDIAQDGVGFSNANSGNWAYKRELTVNNTGSALTDYQLQVQPFTDSAFLNNTGLVGSWHMNGGTSGAIANGSTVGLEDLSGNNNRGIASNTNGTGMGWDNGKFGGAISLDGVDDYVSVPSTSNYDFASSDFTVSTWANFSNNSKGYQFIADRRGTADQTGWILYLEGNNTLTFVSSSTTAWNNLILTNTGYVPPTNTWINIVVTRLGNVFTLYVNGTAIKSGTYTGAIGAQTANLTIGKGHIAGLDQAVGGKIDDFKIYKRGMTGTEVSNYYGTAGVPKVRGDYQDVRFVKTDGTELPYWQESDGRYWVKYPGVLAAATTTKISMYYGNPSATFSTDCSVAPNDKANCGSNTFVFFDDFNRSDSTALGDRWDEYGDGNWQIVGGVLYNPTSTAQYSLIIPKAGGTALNYTSLSNPIVESKYKIASAAGPDGHSGIFLRSNTTPDTTRGFGNVFHYTTSLQNQALNVGLAWGSTITTAVSANNWYELKSFSTSNTSSTNAVKVVGASSYLNTVTSTFAVNNNTNIAAASFTNGIMPTYMDDFKVRAYAATEPTTTLTSVTDLPAYNNVGTFSSLSIPTTASHQGKVYQWGELSFNHCDEAHTSGCIGTYTGTSFHAHVYQSDGITLVPDTDLANNSAGLTTSPVSLASLNSGNSAVKYSSLKIGTDFATTNLGYTATAQDFSVSYLYDSTSPTLPTNVALNAGSASEISVSWNASTDSDSGLSGYDVDRASDVAGIAGSWADSGGNCSGIITTTSCVDDNLSPNTKYYYRVRSVDNIGNFSAYSTGVSASGGTVAYTDSNGLNPRLNLPYDGGYVVHTFTSSSVLDVSVGGSVDYLVVAGGGGGAAGGGGGGGLVTGTTTLSNSPQTVTIGNGGVAGGGYSYTATTQTSGGNSVFGSITAAGGGAGGRNQNDGAYPGAYNGLAGGSSGGGAYSSGYTTTSAATSPTGQGYQGGGNGVRTANYPAGGGGGAGSAGVSGSTGTAGAGGNGLASSISGVSTIYAGGGGGGLYGAGAGGAGGTGGGGNGGIAAAGTNGTNGLGGGGGGAGNLSVAGAGGSGVVIIRYRFLPPVFASTRSLTPSLLAPVANQNTSKPIVAGIGATPSSIVRLYDNGAWKASTTAGVDGTFEFNENTIGYQDFTTGLHNNITVRSYNDSGETVDSNAVEVILDMSSPNTILPADLLQARLDSVNGNIVVDNNWGNRDTLYFDWNDAIDAPIMPEINSGIKQYYVSMSDDSDNIPAIAGNSVVALTSESSITIASPQPGLTYYLRIQSEDNAGNISLPTTLFSYRFDNTPPSAISYITPSPTGWSANNSFTFTWQNVNDNGSGIDKYYYRRKMTANADEWEEWTSDRSIQAVEGDNVLSNIEALYSGLNLIQIRGADLAGNFSAVTQVNYYFSGDIPSPQNLRVDLSQSQNQTANRYSFTWDNPTGVTPQGFYYSINAEPDTQNSTYIPYGGSNTTTTGFSAFATKIGLNKFYVVTKANDNVGWSQFAMKEFTCNTAEPGIPTNVLITDSSSRESQRWQLTVNWDRPSEIGQDFNGYSVERSTDGDNYSEIATTSAQTTGYLDTNLLNSVSYSYRIRAKDNTGNKSATSSVVTKQPTGKYTTPPELASGPKNTILATKAVVTWTTDREADSFVQVGATTSYGMTQGQLDSTTDHSVNLSGLTPGTTYHYRAMWRDIDGNIGYSMDKTFRTQDAPGISEVTISDIRLNSAIVSWKSTTISTSQLHYGKTNTYGSVAKDESASSVTVHVIKLDDLDHSRTYHFKISSIDADGNAVSSDDYSFETLKFPLVSNLKVEQLKNMPTSTVKITWDSNVPTTSVVGYSGRESAKSALELKHSVTITGLKDNTVYLLSVTGRDQYGTEAVAIAQSLKTEFDSRPPLVTNVTTETSIVGFGAEARTQVIISWETDEPCTSQIEYDFGTFGDGYTLKTQEDTGLTTSHVVIVSGLKSSTSYHFRTASRDASGNTGYSEDNTILTEQASSSIIDIIVNSLQNSLGWIFGSFSRS